MMSKSKILQTARWDRLSYVPGSEDRAVVKGTRMRASTIWSSMLANQLSVEEAAEDRNLDIEAVRQAVDVCQSHQDALAQAADRTRERLVADRILRD